MDLSELSKQIAKAELQDYKQRWWHPITAEVYVPSGEWRVASGEFRVASSESRVPRCEFPVASSEFPVASSEFTRHSEHKLLPR